MLNEFLFTKIEEEETGNIQFQLDGAACHTAKAALDFLRTVFEERIISRRADVVWPTQNCNLTPLDYYLWGAVKDKYYAYKPETIDALRNNIREAICAIQLALIAAELMLFGHLGTAIGQRWTIICGVPSKISVTPTSQRQLML